jgi:hypothetical protein
MINLASEAVRAKLEARDAPYYMSLDGVGQSIGFRKHQDGGAEWCARIILKDAKTGKRSTKYQTFAGVASYDAAIAKAAQWFSDVSGGAAKVAEVVVTVSDYLRMYRDHLRAEGKPEDAIRRMENNHRNVDEESIGAIDAEKLTARQVADWRSALLNGQRTRKDARPDRGMELGKLAASTVNRYKKDFFAALNWATDIAFKLENRNWRIKKNLKETIGRHGEMIKPEHRDAILAATPEGWKRDYLLCVMATGARPIELTAQRCRREHLDLTGADASVKLLSFKGKGSEARWRECGISKVARGAFQRFAANKLPKAALFTDDKGQPIKSDRMSRLFDRICKQLGFGSMVKNEETGAMEWVNTYQLYDGRHSRIASLLDRGVDSQTVSVSTGTSLQMIDRHYKKYLRKEAVAKMAAAGF